MADEKTILSYKGHPLMRKDNLVYYGSMADSHIVMLQILETKKVGDSDIASKVSVERKGRLLHRAGSRLRMAEPRAEGRKKKIILSV